MRGLAHSVNRGAPTLKYSVLSPFKHFWSKELSEPKVKRPCKSGRYIDALKTRRVPKKRGFLSRWGEGS